jgi:hypothetical protein
MSNELLKEARTHLEAFDAADVSEGSLDQLSYAFDLLDELVEQVGNGEFKQIAVALRLTFTRSLLKKLFKIDRGDEETCIRAGRFVMLRAFREARITVESDPTLAGGYHALRDAWSEWGSLLPPLIGPAARRFERLLEDT